MRAWRPSLCECHCACIRVIRSVQLHRACIYWVLMRIFWQFLFFKKSNGPSLHANRVHMATTNGNRDPVYLEFKWVIHIHYYHKLQALPMACGCMQGECRTMVTVNGRYKRCECKARSKNMAEVFWDALIEGGHASPQERAK